MLKNRPSPYLLVVIILPFALFWRWLLQGEVLYWGTLLFQFWPWHQLVKTSLLAGEWPLWNPLLGNGSPLLANLQSAVFYPPNLLYLVMPVEHGLTFSVLFHLLLAGLFMVLYTQQLGLTPFAAAVSALTYMCSGYLIGRTQFVTIVNAAAWLPIILSLCENIARRHPLSQRGGLAVIGLSLALTMPLLAGHAQLWFYSLWLAAAYTVVRGWQTAKSCGDRSPWSGSLQAGWRLGLALALGLLLAAAQLLPTAELVLESDRSSGAERTFALTYSFWPWRLITLLAPTFFGHPATGDYWGYANFWEDHAYVGVLPLLFMLVAVWRYLRGMVKPVEAPTTEESHRGQPTAVGGQTCFPAYRQVIPFFAALIPISLVLAMGWNTPIYLWVFDHVPGFGYFQAPARLLIWTTVAMAVLAGVGAHILPEQEPYRPLWRRLLVASLGIAVAVLIGALLVTDRSRTFLVATFTLGLWLALSITWLLKQPEAGAAQRQVTVWQWTGLVLVAVDLLLAAFPLLPMLPAAVYTQPIASAEFLQKQPGNYRFFVTETSDYQTKFNQYFRFETFGSQEIGHWRQFRESLVPNLGIYAGLPSLNNDDPLTIGRWERFTELVNQADPAGKSRLLGLANGAYFIDHSAEAVGAIIYTTGSMSIQQLPAPQTRAYLVERAVLVSSEHEMIARMTAPDFDSGREVVIMADEAEFGLSGSSPDPAKTASLPTDIKPVTINTSAPGQVSLTVETTRPGFVVLADTFYPGWEATIDGRPVPIWPANLAFRAVAMPAGDHTVIFNYRPLSFRLGLGVSLISLLAVIGLGGFMVRNSDHDYQRNQT